MGGLDVNVIISSAITSVVNGVAVFVTVRWLSKAMDKIERKDKRDKEN